MLLRRVGTSHAFVGCFTHLAPVLNLRDLEAERAFYEQLGLAVTYEGDEYPGFLAFTTESVHLGIQRASAENDPPSVLTWQIGVSDVDAVAEVCRTAGLEFTLEQEDPAPGWRYRRLILRSPSGYRVALEGPNEPKRAACRVGAVLPSGCR
jgi:catechol 2,3-dioxygenase-like lactoylglutathione lyase family enzyme